jgi:hypothetical protein
MNLTSSYIFSASTHLPGWGIPFDVLPAEQPALLCSIPEKSNTQNLLQMIFTWN